MNWTDLSLPFATFGLIFALAAEHTQILAKVAGARSGKRAHGYNHAMKIMVFNRFGAAIYFFMMGLSIDLGATSGALSFAFCSAGIVVGTYNSYLLISPLRAMHLVRIPALDSSEKKWTDLRPNLRTVWISFLATVFGLLGLSLPMLIASEYAEYRLSLANTGFILNSLFTIINVFLIESKLAQLIDQSNPNLNRYIRDLILGRAAAATFLAIVMAAYSQRVLS